MLFNWLEREHKHDKEGSGSTATDQYATILEVYKDNTEYTVR
jgi:hypothetical protein